MLKNHKLEGKPDETAHYELSRLDLHCLQIQLLLCLVLYLLIVLQYFFLQDTMALTVNLL